MEALSVLFIIGSMWFWLSASVLFFIVLALSENDHNIMAGIALLAFLSIINFFNPLLISFTFTAIIMWSFIYFVLGGVWSFIKWFSHLKIKADKFECYKTKWIEEFNVKNPDNELNLGITTNIKETIGAKAAHNFREYLYDNNYLRYLTDPVFPNATDNKEKIINWILYWPTSLFWTIMSDPLVRLANWIYDRFGNVYTAIANYVFKGVGVGRDV